VQDASPGSAAVLGVKARARAVGSEAAAPPTPPSDAGFRFSRASILALLRFYGWCVPDEWAWEDTPVFWSAAAEAQLTVDGPAQPVHASLLFSPSPALQRHFAYVHAQCSERREHEAGATSLTPAGADSSPVAKRARLEIAAPASRPLHCLDVACGSGRDMAWLLFEAQRLSDTAAQNPSASTTPCWLVTGIDSAAGALTRAKQLAEQLGFAKLATVQRARINQSTGHVHVHGVPAAAAIPAVAEAVNTGDGVAETKNKVDSDTQADAAPDSASASAVTLANAKPNAQRKEKRKRKEALRAAAAAASASTTSTAVLAMDSAAPFNGVGVSCSLLSPAQYDLVLMVRFLCRPFLVSGPLLSLLRPGGFFLLSTFTDDGVTSYAQPSNPAFRLKGTAEVEQIAAQAGLTIIANAVDTTEDGRPISDVLLQKPWT